MRPTARILVIVALAAVFAAMGTGCARSRPFRQAYEKELLKTSAAVKQLSLEEFCSLMTSGSKIRFYCAPDLRRQKAFTLFAPLGATREEAVEYFVRQIPGEPVITELPDQWAIQIGGTETPGDPTDREVAGSFSEPGNGRYYTLQSGERFTVGDVQRFYFIATKDGGVVFPDTAELERMELSFISERWGGRILFECAVTEVYSGDYGVTAGGVFYIKKALLDGAVNRRGVKELKDLLIVVPHGAGVSGQPLEVVEVFEGVPGRSPAPEPTGPSRPDGPVTPPRPAPPKAPAAPAPAPAPPPRPR